MDSDGVVETGLSVLIAMVTAVYRAAGRKVNALSFDLHVVRYPLIAALTSISPPTYALPAHVRSPCNLTPRSPHRTPLDKRNPNSGLIGIPPSVWKRPFRPMPE